MTDARIPSASTPAPARRPCRRPGPSIIVVTCEPGDNLVEQTALGQRASLVFNVGETPRAFYGIVAAVRLAEVHAAEASTKYLVRLVPRLWLLRKKTRSRIFQNLRVPDVVTSVLQEAGIATRWQLTRAYPLREYVTQYEETDYAFVRRLLAEAGILYYFFGGPPVEPPRLPRMPRQAPLPPQRARWAVRSRERTWARSSARSLRWRRRSSRATRVIGADDASCYPSVGGDNATALGASTAAALASAAADAVGAGDGIAGAAVGAASAVAGAVIADVSEAASASPVLHFLANREVTVTKQDKVTAFMLRNTVRSSGAAYREYDPDRPAVRLQSAAVATDPFPMSPLEAAAAALATTENAASAVEAVVPVSGPAAGALGAVESAVDTAVTVASDVGAALGQKVPFEVYQHHGTFLFPKWAFGSDEAPKILRQKRRRASIAKAEGGCSDLSPGHVFTLADHPATQLDGKYVVTRVEHRGETRPTSAQDFIVYRNAFECAPATMSYVPPRPTRKSVQVMLTATVVGPAGEEIYVDDKGQIKVQFHWDREGAFDDKSSCWIRVMQPWGGAGWVHQFIPRVGMEVVVSFEGGDPDKPMVLGSVYNGTHPPAFKLPEQRSRSGIRTSSYPGGHGFNELSFDDASGHEQVFIHAQHDLHEVVQHNHATEVRANQTQTVRGQQVESIERDQRLTVGGDRTGGGWSRAQEHRGRLPHDHRHAQRRARCGRRRARDRSGHYAVDVKRGYSLTVGSSQEGGQSDHHVNGSCSIGAAQRLMLHAEKGLVIQCGDTVLRS